MDSSENDSAASPISSIDMISVVGYTFEGVLVMTVNAFMFVRIMSIRQLRNQKEYIIMSACILFDASFGAAYFSAGIWRAYIYFTYEYIPAWSQWECFLTPSVQLFILITPTAGYILLLTAVDRFLCIFCPIRYLKFPVKYSYAIMFLPYIFDIPTHVISFFDAYYASEEKNKSMICMMYMGISVGLYSLQRAIRILCSLFAVLIYIPVAVKMFLIIRRHQLQVGMSTKGEKKLLRLTGTIALITINTLVLFTIPDIITYFQPTVNTFAFYLMNLNKGVVNIVALLATQSPLRRLFHSRNSQMAASSFVARKVTPARARPFVPST